MSRLPLVSIITAALNSERFLKDCIESVLSQTYPHLEYIIVDGGSSDGTLSIIDSYRSRFGDRLRLVTAPEGGISGAFNKGIETAGGDLIGILNSDDYYGPRTVERVVGMKDRGCGFLFGDMIYISETGSELFRCCGDPDYESKIRYRMPALNHPTVFVRKHVYEELGCFDPCYRYAMDYELLLRFWSQGVRGRHIGEVLAWQRLGGKSDRNYRLAYAECRDISIRYGLNRLAASLFFCFITAKAYGRRLVDSKLPAEPAMWLRRKINTSIR